LWLKVLAHKYGMVKGVIFDGGGKTSGLWKDLQSIRQGSGFGFSNMFDNHLVRAWVTGIKLNFGMIL